MVDKLQTNCGQIVDKSQTNDGQMVHKQQTNYRQMVGKWQTNGREVVDKRLMDKWLERSIAAEKRNTDNWKMKTGNKT